MAGVTEDIAELSQGVPCLTAARDLHRLLTQEGRPHVHLHAPPGFGKTSVALRLAELWQAEGLGPVRRIDLSSLQWPVESPVARIAADLGTLRSAMPELDSAEGAAEWVATTGLAAVRRGIAEAVAGGGRLLMILDCAERLLEQDGSGLLDALPQSCRLLTLSVAPWHLIDASAHRTLVPSVTLGRYPAAQDTEDDYLSAFPARPERSGAQDDASFRDDAADWLDRFIADSGIGDESLIARMRKLFEGRHIQRRDELFDGHPLMDFRLTARMLGALAQGRDPREERAAQVQELAAAQAQAAEGGRSSNDWMHAYLLPDPVAATDPDAPQRKWLSPLVLGGIGEALRDLVAATATETPVDARTLDWAVASGLVCRDGPLGWSWSALSGLVEKAPPQPGGAMERLALAMQRQADGLRRIAEDHRTHFDPRLRAIIDHVQEKLCETAEGLSLDRQIDLSPGRTRTLVEGRVYRVGLHWRAEPAPPAVAAGSKARPGPRRAPQRVQCVILVFDTGSDLAAQGDQRGFLRRQIRNLSLLGRLRHRALPAFGTGGVLERGTLSAVERPFIEIKDPGERVTPRAMLRHFEAVGRSGGAAALLAELAQIADGLARMHGLGLIHQTLDFSALRLVEADGASGKRVVISGFEQSVLLRAVMNNEQQGTDRVHRAADEDLACRCPDGAQIDASFDPGVDNYSLAAIAILALTGPLQDSALDAANALLRTGTPESQHRARLVLREDLLRPERWTGLDLDAEVAQPLAEVLRAALISHGQDAQMQTQKGASLTAGLTMPQLAARLSYLAHKAAPRMVRAATGKRLLLVYAPAVMAQSLNRIGRQYDLPNFDGNTPEGIARLTQTLQDWVDAARRLYFSRAGFPKPGEPDKEPTRRASKYVLSGGPFTLFASPRRDHQDEYFDALFVSYAIHPSQLYFAAQPDLAETPLARPTDEWRRWVDLDAVIDIVPISELSAQRRAQDYASWEDLAQQAARRAREGDESGKIEEALNVWRIHRDYLRAIDEMKRFPVMVRKKGSDDEVDLHLDGGAYESNLRQSRLGFFWKAILMGRPRQSFFEETLLKEMTEGGGSGSVSIDFGKGARRSQVRVIHLSRGDGGLTAIIDGQLPDFEHQTQGRIRLSSSIGTQVAVSRQDQALDRVARKSWLMPRLVEPADSGTYLPPVRDAHKTLQKRIAIMMGSTPVHAVQGPPGTGKTTLQAGVIAEALGWNDGSRLLVTSQSHAATDNILDAVIRRLRQDHPDRDDVPPGTAIRIFPEERSGRVDPTVERDFSLQAQTRRLSAACRASAKRHEDRPQLARAVAALRKVGYFELRSRVERTAPLVFSTTGAAPLTLPYLSSDRMPDYDMTIIDEAAKAWSLDLLMPMSLADRVIAVGDPMQLPPFGETDFLGFLRNAAALRQDDAAPPELVALLDPAETGSEAGSERFSGFLGWLKLFHRILEKAPPRTSEMLGSGIPVTQLLDTQYRSVAAIGTFVSKTFYLGRVRNGGPDPDPDLRLTLPLRDTVAPAVAGKPAIVWIDTQPAAGSRAYVERNQNRGRISNPGEIEVIATLLRQFSSGNRPTWERLKLMSPYQSQVRAIQTLVLKLTDSLRIGVEEIGKVVMTTDSSQGSESDIVIVSLCRSEPESRDRLRELLAKPHLAGNPRDLDRLERELRGTVGFLTAPERMNVICSRARQQLILIGDHSQFAEVARAIEILESVPGKTAPGDGSPRLFWSAILDQFTSAADRPVTDTERPVIIPAGWIERTRHVG